MLKYRIAKKSRNKISFGVVCVVYYNYIAMTVEL